MTLGEELEPSSVSADSSKLAAFPQEGVTEKWAQAEAQAGSLLETESQAVAVFLEMELEFVLLAQVLARVSPL